MNSVDGFVTKVLSAPYEKYGKWWVKVEYDSWGVTSKTELMFNSKVEALLVDKGYKFLC